MPEKRNRRKVKTCGSAGDPVPSTHADVCDLTYGRGSSDVVRAAVVAKDRAPN